MHGAQPLSGREVQLASYPDGEPRPSDFRIVEVPVREPGPGEVLVRNTWTSVDPGLRLRLAERARRRATSPRSVCASPMDGIMTVGEVIESRADGFSAGDTVRHAAGWRDYAVVAAGTPALGGLGTLTRLDTGLAPAQRYLGPLGGMGLTAYAGLFDVAEPARGRRRLGVGRGRGRRKPRRAVRQAPRPSRDRQRGVRREGLLPARRARARRRLQPPSRAPSPTCCARPRPTGSTSTSTASAATTSKRRSRPCARADAWRSAGPSPNTGAPREDRPTCSRRRPTTSRCAASAAAATCTGWATWCATSSGWLADGRLRYRETIVDGLERAPAALARMLAGDTIGKTLVRIA